MEEVHMLNIKAMPNPSTIQFKLVTESSSSEPCVIRIIDNYGRVIETKNNVAANGSFTIGQNFRPGLYYVEVLQGKKKATVKLIKQSY
jgi:flagellar hook assembly protein FlgD